MRKLAVSRRFDHKTLRWKATARAAIEAAGFRCCIPWCPERWCLQAHHIIPADICDDPYDLKNIEVRCPDHHMLVHGLCRVPAHWRILKVANDAQMELPLEILDVAR